MRLRGETVLFQLSPEGQQVFTGLFETKFKALVIDEDDLGLWISPERFPTEAAQAVGVADDKPRKVIPVYLLKRDYFSTAELDKDPESIADLTAAESI